MRTHFSLSYGHRGAHSLRCVSYSTVSTRMWGQSAASQSYNTEHRHSWYGLYEGSQPPASPTTQNTDTHGMVYMRTVSRQPVLQHRTQTLMVWFILGQSAASQSYNTEHRHSWYGLYEGSQPPASPTTQNTDTHSMVYMRTVSRQPVLQHRIQTLVVWFIWGQSAASQSYNTEHRHSWYMYGL